MILHTSTIRPASLADDDKFSQIVDITVDHSEKILELDFGFSFLEFLFNKRQFSIHAIDDLNLLLFDSCSL